MATSPEFIRLATSSSRALADTALDSLRDAVVIVNARHRHLPVVLANAAARRCLIEDTDTFGLIESPLFYWMTPESAAIIETSLRAPSDHRSTFRHILEWRGTVGVMFAIAKVKPLVSSPGRRPIMLTFAPVTFETDFASSLRSNLKLDLTAKASGTLNCVAKNAIALNGAGWRCAALAPYVSGHEEIHVAGTSGASRGGERRH